MKVFLDASALVPLAVARDPWRARLEQSMRQLRRPELVTSNWTLYEALPLAGRFGHRLALDLFERVNRTVAVASVSVDEELEALRRFLSFSDKTASVVDHANILVARREQCQAVLTFDDDFLDIAPTAGLLALD